MKVADTHTLNASRQQVWDALQDPNVLAATLPGCRELTAQGDGVYKITLDVGVASITGTYTGEVALADQVEPEAYTLKASGSGGPGTVDASARITLEEAGPGTTRLSYDADAIVGGTIAGVGQRVLIGVAKRNAQQFFEAVDRYLAGETLVEPAPTEAEAAPAAAGAPTEATGVQPGQVFRAPAKAGAAGGDPRWLLGAGVLGALIALAGVLVGRRLAR
ncbi:carbon monoxide dehydrogenase [Egibacter rhizosphaerae]|uniref:Carbon monoxide dehydrogenase n=1 Tax=Egibacter rhizosphaerae TaxID=1670831 RepID=A0A411YD19_9ACTN|nr:carbon monoxide dehydrogenase subunit G [Egibacter rhizosphaerae]QBI19090.1 carbon monoxide dehydrogenase [Egibacter rhizosphaerae]